MDNIHSGELEKAEYEVIPGFNLAVPKSTTGVDSTILKPENTWEHHSVFLETERKLASQFVDNFKKYEDGTPKEVVKNGGPDMSHFLEG